MHKILKVSICFVLVFTFLFVQPMQKIKEVEAGGPLLLVVEKLLQGTAIKMGLDFVSGDALDKFSKTAAGEFIKKKTGINFGRDLEVEAGSGFGGGDSDGGGAGRKFKVNVSPELNAALVDEVSDYAESVIKSDVERKTKYIQPINTVSDLIVEKHDPLYNTGIEATFTIDDRDYARSARGLNFILTYLDLHIIPLAFNQYSFVRLVNPLDGSYFNVGFNGGTKVDIFTKFESTYVFFNKFNGESVYQHSYNGISVGFYNHNTSSYGSYNAGLHIPNQLVNAFNAQVKAIEQRNIVSHYANGVVVTAGHASALRLPDNIDISDIAKLDLPVEYKKPQVFEFDLPASIELSPTLISLKQGDKIDFNQVSNYFERTDVTTMDVKNYNNVVNVSNNNNYFVSETQQTIINEQIVAVLPSVPEPSDPGGVEIIDNPKNDLQLQVEVNGFKYCVDKESNMAVACGEIEAPDASIFTYLGNAYDYGINAVNTASNALASILDGSKGLVALYTGIFEWLPPEVTVILTSGLLLMIGLRVFRK